MVAPFILLCRILCLASLGGGHRRSGWFSPSLSLTSSADLVADSPFRLSGVLVREFKDVYSKRSPILRWWRVVRLVASNPKSGVISFICPIILKGDCSKCHEIVVCQLLVLLSKRVKVRGLHVFIASTHPMLQGSKSAPPTDCPFLVLLLFVVKTFHPSQGRLR
ncbi:hypothetical protein HID58_076510 [Brassica napus]|uniref:Secreted protein n=1 Tax=Brassica napus TaxID=3708 RepID=A0ABQ7YQ94_BRANA|nr:hypothetical protein HID58_076510 [Brassica napus]